MKNLSTDTPGDDQDAVDRLYDGLVEKTAAVDEPGGIEDDEDESTVGTMAQPDEEPKERPENTIDAPWGEDSPAGMQFAAENYKKFREGREVLLDKLLDSKGPGDSADKNLISQHFTHGKKGGFETSSPQLSDQARKVVNED